MQQWITSYYKEEKEFQMVRPNVRILDSLGIEKTHWKLHCW